jgi:hypothetical protein
MLILKTPIMLTFEIITHQTGKKYYKPTIFILSKGINSGKPMKQATANCFAIIVKTDREAEDLYHVALALWQTKFWHQFLIGSVILFLRITDFKEEFYEKSKVMLSEHEEHVKTITNIKELQKVSDLFNQNLILIEEMKRAVLYRYCNK